MLIATITTKILKLHSCYAHKTTENRIHVEQLSYLVKAAYSVTFDIFRNFLFSF